MRRAPAIAALLVLGPGAVWAQGTDVLALIDALQEDAAEHRSYLEGLYTQTLGVITLVIAVVGGFLAFLGWKTLKDVQDSAKAVFDKEIKRLMDQYAADLGAEAERVKQKITEAEAELTAAIGEMRDKVAAMEVEMAGQRLASDALIQASGADPDPVPPMPPPAPAPGTAADVPAQKRVLWVDDEPTNNDGPAKVLMRLGAHIDQAFDTDQAMAMLAAGGYDLVISDMGRPRDSDAGVTLLEAMRVAGDATPVVIYASRNAVARTREQVMNLGAMAAIGAGPTALLGQVKPFLFPVKD